MLKIKNNKELFISTDGGSRGNPGPSAIGVVIKDKNNKVISEVSKFIGITTNNVAEYLAVIYGLQECAFIGAETLVLNVDSQLIARQLTGKYKVKDSNMRIFHGIATNLMRFFKKVTIVEVPREDNHESDKLVNKAFENKTLL